MEYPVGKRGQFFSHRFTRLVHKTALANELGADVVLLLVVIVHTEDAARYSGPVSFWNSQLSETLGLKKWERLNRCRKAAMDAGWLQYEDGGNRKPGRYWVTIPDGYEQISDSPMEQCTPIQPKNGYDEGYKQGYDAGYDAGYKAGYVQVDVQGYVVGEPYSPVPKPSPPPPLGADPGKPLVCAGGVEQVIIPEKLNTPECLAAAETWFAYLDGRQLQDRNPKYNAPQLQVWWQKMGRKTPAEFLRDIEGSIAKGWKAVEDCSPIDWTGKAAGGLGVDPDFLKAREAYKRWSDGTEDHKRKRAEFLGPYLMKVCRKVGGQCFVSAKDGPEMQRLAAEFDRVKKELAE